jgi:3'-5' exoribonuclease 1
MPKSLDMTFEGKEHSGIDDARNILRIVYRLATDGCRLEFNTDLKKHKAKRGKWSKMRNPVAL